MQCLTRSRYHLLWMMALWSILLMTMGYAFGEGSIPRPAPLTWEAPRDTTALAASPSLTAGRDAFQRGDIERAITDWQEAVRSAAETRQPQAQSVALTHLAHAYMTIGQYDRAEPLLLTALQLAQQAGDPLQTAVIRERQGTLALGTGDVTAAERYLNEALPLARQLDDAGLTAAILYTQGNLLMATQQAHTALDVYRNAAALAHRARQFGSAVRAFAQAAVAAERDEQPHMAQTLLAEALGQLQHAESDHDTAYDLIFIGRAYHRLATAEPTLVLRAAAMFTEAATLAQRLHDVRALSYAWGYWGQLYEDARRYQEALDLTRRAALAAHQVHIPESLYLWQWQTGRILRALGDREAATNAYERALATVQSMRAALWRRTGDASWSFRAALGPLYFELVDLYLHQATADESRDHEERAAQSESALQRARLTVEQFKTAELRDYFGDECVTAAQPRLTALDRVDPEAVIVYPVLLPERTDVVVSLPSGLRRVTVPVGGADLEQRVRILRNAIDRRDPFRYLQHAQQLYTWLIRPLEAELAGGQIQTIIFVPDGALRLLPLAALHDGQHFLIEKYALAMTPSLTLTEPRPWPQSSVSVLAAGVTRAVEDFPPLPRVADELQSLQRLYHTTVLLNQDFSPERLDQALRQGTFGIVHIAAHSQFTAQAAQSFLLTAQGRLTVERLAEMVGRLRFRAQPIELLTLSACATAVGDDRAALGLAGVALQAGARSALATLWLVQDDAAAVLMQTFYQQLQVPGTSRARALQQAQLSVLKDPRYADPVFWAPFLLLNNWR